MRNKFLCALFGACMFLGANPALRGQQAQTSPDTVQLKQHTLRYDQSLGAAAASLGEGRLRQIDVTLIEIAPGGKLAAHRHLAEEMLYIVSGSGYTLMWAGQEGKPAGKEVKYEWKEGDLLSPSLNAWHQHFNASADTPARYLSITTAPLTENIFQNREFLSSVQFGFDGRWGKSVGLTPQYVGNATEGPETVQMDVGHLLPNLRNREMKVRGLELLGITILPEGDMAGNRLLEMEVREFMNGDSITPHHRHLWETAYYILKGDGYALLQREGGPERRLEWKEGDLFIVEANEYHTHRPRGEPGGRFLQIKASGYFRRVGIDDYLMQNKPTDP